MNMATRLKAKSWEYMVLRFGVVRSDTEYDDIPTGKGLVWAKTADEAATKGYAEFVRGWKRVPDRKGGSKAAKMRPRVLALEDIPDTVLVRPRYNRPKTTMQHVEFTVKEGPNAGQVRSDFKPVGPKDGGWIAGGIFDPPASHRSWDLLRRQEAGLETATPDEEARQEGEQDEVHEEAPQEEDERNVTRSVATYVSAAEARAGLERWLEYLKSQGRTAEVERVTKEWESWLKGV
jgi:hypothetical protein